MPQLDRRLFTHLNWVLLGISIMIVGVGLVNLYSASGFRMEEGFYVSPNFSKQIYWGLIGLGVMLCTMFVDYRHLKLLAWPSYIIAIGFLVAVLILGKMGGGSQRWIALGPLNFQPSELAKISILLIGAKILSEKQKKLDWPGLIMVMALGAIPAALVYKQPDLGGALNLLLLLGGIILYRGLEGRVLKVLMIVLPMLVPLGWFILKPYQKNRVMIFLNPGMDPRGKGYNIIQSKTAIGSGGIWGKGFLAGTQSQLRFLPEKHTDFAIAVFGEEWGFVGCMTLLALFCLFLLSIFATARDAKDRFGSFLAAGVFFYFFWQILINIGMVLGLMPVVGIPLPFISYGGSAMLVNFCLVGLVLNVSMRRFSYQVK